MTTLEDLVQEECDFCGCSWDENLDEPLVPLHLGDPPQPQPVESRGVQGNFEYGDTHSAQAKLDSILKAMQDMDGLEYEVYENVEEVSAIGGDTHFAEKAGEGGPRQFTPEVDSGKTAAKLRFHPEPREVEPDAMVCSECAEMFRNLGDE
jgi:hypothetical protein